MTGVLLDKADSLGPPLITLACGVQLLQRYLRFRRRRGLGAGQGCIQMSLSSWQQYPSKPNRYHPHNLYIQMT